MNIMEERFRRLEIRRYAMDKRKRFILAAAFLGISLAAGSTGFCAYAEENKASGKKGLHLQYHELDHVKELGLSHVIFNEVCATSPQAVREKSSLKEKYKMLSDQGVSTTLIMLNPWQSENPLLLPTNQKVAGAAFYNFYAATPQAKENLRQIAREYAGMYTGVVKNWIIGNEINDARLWNYSPAGGISEYSEEYAEAFRIWYEEIKAADPFANVFIPFDYRFNWYSDQGKGYYQAMPMIRLLNEKLKDTDYGIAWHAYPQDLVSPVFSDDADAKQTAEPPIITMKNINALTDFMQGEEFLRADRTVRNIILSEQGFNATNETLQAESIVSAYEIARENPHIDAFMLSRLIDSGDRLHGQELFFGLMKKDGSRRASYEAYKNLK